MDWKLGGLIAAAVGVAGISAFLYLSQTGYFAEREAKAVVARHLKDPDSARYSSIQTAGNGLAACGLVNAKNSMGGYTGDTFFMVWKEDAFFATDERMVAIANCCDAMLKAVKNRTDSAETQGFDQCEGLVEPFKW